MKSYILIFSLVLGGCSSNAADKVAPAPTNLHGIYTSSFFSSFTTWVIRKDGTGFTCQRQGDMRNLIVNGNNVYDIYKFDISEINEHGFTAKSEEIKKPKRIIRRFKKRIDLPHYCEGKI